MRSDQHDQSSRCFRVGHCHVKLTGIDNKRNENNFTQSKGAKVNKYRWIRESNETIEQRNYSKLKSMYSRKQIANLADIACIVWKRGNNIVFLDAVE